MLINRQGSAGKNRQAAVKTNAQKSGKPLAGAKAKKPGAVKQEASAGGVVQTTSRKPAGKLAGATTVIARDTKALTLTELGPVVKEA